MTPSKKFSTVLIGVLILAVVLTGCGKRRNYAQCVDSFNNVVDPAQCQSYGNQYGSNIGNAAWISAIPYHYATGGRMNGLQYVGGSSVPVYQPLPKGYAPVSQKSYTKTYTKINHTTPSTIKTTPTTKAPKSTTPTTAKKSTNDATPNPSKNNTGSGGTTTKTPTKSPSKSTTKKSTTTKSSSKK